MEENLFCTMYEQNKTTTRTKTKTNKQTNRTKFLMLGYFNNDYNKLTAFITLSLILSLVHDSNVLVSTIDILINSIITIVCRVRCF